jgi:hypothetical protein
VPYNYYNAMNAEPILRSGLYVVRSFVSDAEEQAYVLYWPEDTTWDDQAISTVQRNRVTFMRWGLLFIPYCVPYSRMRGSYLTKLCDQLVCLLSAAHSKAIVWNDDSDDDDVSTHSEDDDSDRLYYFEVAKTNDQEENVVARPGFTVYIFITNFLLLLINFCYKVTSQYLVDPPSPLRIPIDPRALSPRILHGETAQGFMTAEFKPADRLVEPFTLDHQSDSQVRLLR